MKSMLNCFNKRTNILAFGYYYSMSNLLYNFHYLSNKYYYFYKAICKLLKAIVMKTNNHKLKATYFQNISLIIYYYIN